MQYNQTQQMLTLSFLAYLGFELDHNERHNANKIEPRLSQALETWDPIAGDWELVWGPAVYKFHFATFDDNLMYVVKHKSKANTYTIAIRGTNPISLSDWVFEDFLVTRQLPWPTARNAGKLKPKVSYAAHLGLQALINMVAQKGVPGEGEDLKTFLTQAVNTAKGAPIHVNVTGHSLAGALAPMLSLWLADTQGADVDETWDEGSVAEISCTAFAGPSPGNSDFATYYDQALGANTQRIHNYLDVVPHAWSKRTMKGALSLYEGTASPNFLLRTAYHYFRWTTRRLDYQQILPDAPSFPGRIEPALHSFELQMAAQHVKGYTDEFGLTECLALDILKDLLPTTADKTTEPA